MRRTPLHRALSLLTRPLSLPYARALRTRRSLFAQGRLKSYTPACPTVSVGNIALGGTGKTPLVSWLLDWAAGKALHAVVLTRGYGGKPGSSPLLVTPDTPASRSGDEPLMLALSHPKAAVLAFPKRSESARLAEAGLSPDFFILDDGMQHLAVARDLDIVLLRPRDLDEEWNRVLPGGSWREGGEALAAAHAFVLKVSPEEFRQCASAVKQRLASFRVPVFSYELKPTGLHELSLPGAGLGQTLSPGDEALNTPYLLVSGVGNPEGVEETAARLMGRPRRSHLVFEDHHVFTRGDAGRILSMARKDAQAFNKNAPLPIVCTAKDAVKLAPLREYFEDARVWVLETAPVFGPNLFTDLDFPEWWEAWWERQKDRRT